MWKKLLLSLQPHIDILVELSSTCIVHPAMCHNQYNVSCCGKKLLVINQNTARKCHDIKSKEVCPSKYWTMTPASELIHTNYTCLRYWPLTHVAPIIVLERWPLIQHGQW